MILNVDFNTYVCQKAFETVAVFGYDDILLPLINKSLFSA